MRTLLRTVLLAAAVAAVAPTAFAQGPLSTGTFVAGRDQNWDVAVGTGAFIDAFQVASNPGWNDFNGPTAARWISFATSASNPGGTPYYFRTTFDLTGYDPFTAILGFQCGVDNTTRAVRLNGNAVSAGCPFGVLSAVQVLSSGFSSGTNSLEFEVLGDGTTDGFIYNTTSFSAQAVPVTATPEPASVVLMASGLAGLYAFGRRRQR